MRTRFLFLLLFVMAPLLRATSVVPPSFPELVAEADAIYRGRVTAVEARRVDRANGGRVIKTFVTLAIDRVLKGPTENSVTLEFLGGMVGDETLEVGGQPKYTVGQAGIVFVQQNGKQFCPLVRLAHGSYRIKRNRATERDYVTRDNLAPLRDVAEVEAPLSESVVDDAAADVSLALSPSAFETRIVNEVRTPTLKARPN